MLDERHEDVEQPIRVDPEHTASQTMVSAQRLDALARDRNQVLDDGRRNVVAVQRRIERRRVLPRARVKPVALQHAAVERCVRVLVVRVGAVKRAIRGGSILLVPFVSSTARYCP